jgi:hypothetical protein
MPVCCRIAELGTVKDRGDLSIVVEGDNQYGVMLVNLAKHPDVKRISATNSSTG